MKTKSRIKKGIPNAPTIFITSPTNRDVLCGRGGAGNNHEGNKAYRALCESKKAVYQSEAIARSQKIEMGREIVEIVQARGGRFVEKQIHQKKTQWFEISDEKAIAKTMQTLRERPKTQKRKSTKLQASSYFDSSCSKKPSPAKKNASPPKMPSVVTKDSNSKTNSASVMEGSFTVSGGFHFSIRAPNSEEKPSSGNSNSNSNATMPARSNSFREGLCVSFPASTNHYNGNYINTGSFENERHPCEARPVFREAPPPYIEAASGNRLIAPGNSCEWKFFDFCDEEAENRPQNHHPYLAYNPSFATSVHSHGHPNHESTLSSSQSYGNANYEPLPLPPRSMSPPATQEEPLK